MPLRTLLSDPAATQAATADSVVVPGVEVLSPFIPTTGTGTGRSREALDTGYFYIKDEIREKGVTMTRKICRLCW